MKSCAKISCPTLKNLYQLLNNLLQFLWPKVALIVRKWRPSDFPLAPDAGLFVERDLIQGYGCFWFKRAQVPSRFSKPRHSLGYPVELVKGFRSSGCIDLPTSDKLQYVIPLAVSEALAPLNILRNGKSIAVVRPQYDNRLLHILVEGGEDLRVLGENFFCGSPLALTSRPKESKGRKAIVMFVDGLEYKTARKAFSQSKISSIEKLGFRFQLSDCTVNGDWTVTSFPCLVSGHYVAKHKIVERDDVLSGEDARIPSALAEEGWYTQHISANWGVTPLTYLDGFDRSIYWQYADLSWILNEARQTFKVFNGRDTFLFLSIFDLHHLINGVPDIDQATAMELSSLDFTDVNKRANIPGRDERREKRYQIGVDSVVEQIIDFLHWLSNAYGEDDIDLFVISDHGQAYLSDSYDALSNERIHVPFCHITNSIKKLKGEVLSREVGMQAINVPQIILERLIGKQFKTKSHVISEKLAELGVTVTESVVRDKPYRFRITCGELYWIFEERSLASPSPNSHSKVAFRCVACGDDINHQVVADSKELGLPENVQRALEIWNCETK